MAPSVAWPRVCLVAWQCGVALSAGEGAGVPAADLRARCAHRQGCCPASRTIARCPVRLPAAGAAPRPPAAARRSNARCWHHADWRNDDAHQRARAIAGQQHLAMVCLEVRQARRAIRAQGRAISVQRIAEAPLMPGFSHQPSEQAPRCAVDAGSESRSGSGRSSTTSRCPRCDSCGSSGWRRAPVVAIDGIDHDQGWAGPVALCAAPAAPREVPAPRVGCLLHNAARRPARPAH